MNSVTLYGNLTRDPELSYTPSGTAVAKTCIAVSERWKDSSGNKKEKTTFVNLTFWGRSGENVAKFFAKGSPILVHGKLNIDVYEKDGQKKYFTSVTVKEFFFTNGRKNGNGGAPQAQGAPQQTYGGARVVAPPTTTSAPPATEQEASGPAPALPDSDIPW